MLICNFSFVNTFKKMANFLSLVSNKITHFVLLICIFCSCQNNPNEVKNSDDYECSGIGCGIPNVQNGIVTIFSNIDTFSYILIKLNKELSVIKSGKFSLSLQDTLLMGNFDVFLLDFNTKIKNYENVAGDVEGYIFPCSDMISNSHIPDTLNFTSGRIDIQIKETVQKKEREYFINLINVQFSKGGKIRNINTFKRKIIFTAGNPG